MKTLNASCYKDKSMENKIHQDRQKFINSLNKMTWDDSPDVDYNYDKFCCNDMHNRLIKMQMLQDEIASQMRQRRILMFDTIKIRHRVLYLISGKRKSKW